MRKLWFIGLITAFILAACQPAPNPQVETATLPRPTSTTASTATLTSQTTSTDTAQNSGCTVTSPRPTPEPIQQSLFPPLGDDDHIFGPREAYISLMEYGDFQ